MGNRGILHDGDKVIQRHFVGRRWIICLLEFNNRKREVMQPRSYTELFFLDEATALAAGHRPCAECQRPRFHEFRRFWAAANPELAGSTKPSAEVIDTVLHHERLYKGKQGFTQQTFNAPLATLADGVFVLPSTQDQPHIIWHGKLLPWTFDGYGAGISASPETVVEVLTPCSVTRAIAAGFTPAVHQSAA